MAPCCPCNPVLAWSVETVRQVCVPGVAGEYRTRQVWEPDQNAGIRNSAPSGSRTITSRSTSEKGLPYDFALVKAHSTGQYRAASMAWPLERRGKLNAPIPATNARLLNRMLMPRAHKL